MFISDKVTMRGDWSSIWRLSSQIEKWPVILPHYRKVKILERDPGQHRVTASMSAWRDILPVSWRSHQFLYYHEDPEQASIQYHHTGGVTKGMEVCWTFTPTGTPGEYVVEITHDWNPGWPLIGGIASRLICQLIVHNIAGKTLNTIKRLVTVQNIPARSL